MSGWLKATRKSLGRTRSDKDKATTRALVAFVFFVALSFRASPIVKPASINPLFEVGLLGQSFRNPGSGVEVEPAGPSLPDQT